METRFYSQNNNEFKIGGKLYHDLTSFTKSIKLKKSGKHSYIYVQKEGLFNIIGYVVEYCEPFPCFDSSDYIYEDRSWSEFFFIDSYEYAKKLYKDFENGNKDKININELERLKFSRNDPMDKTFMTVTKFTV